MSDIDAKYVGHLLEEIRDEVRAVHETVALVPTRGEFEELRQVVSDVQADVRMIKAAVADTNRQVDDHERRITRLEAA